MVVFLSSTMVPVRSAGLTRSQLQVLNHDGETLGPQEKASEMRWICHTLSTDTAVSCAQLGQHWVSHQSCHRHPALAFSAIVPLVLWDQGLLSVQEGGREQESAPFLCQMLRAPGKQLGLI